MTSSLSAHWDAAREIRSVLLRFVAFAILLANLLLGGNEGAKIRLQTAIIRRLSSPQGENSPENQSFIGLNSFELAARLSSMEPVEKQARRAQEHPFSKQGFHSIAEINAGICCSKNFENEAILGGSA